MVKISDSPESQMQAAFWNPHSSEGAYDLGNDKNRSEIQAQRNPFKRLASFVVERTMLPGSSQSSLSQEDRVAAEVIVDELENEEQAEWYTSRYPESVEDFGEAETMGYASRYEEERLVEYKRRVEEAEHNIGVSEYKPEHPYMSAEIEARAYIRKAQEARASADRLALSASEIYKLRQEL